MANKTPLKVGLGELNQFQSGDEVDPLFLKNKTILQTVVQIIHTGTTVETKFYSGLLIPANTIKAGDVLKIHVNWGKTSSGISNSLRLYFNTTDVLAGAVLQGINSSTTNAEWNNMIRHLNILSLVSQRKFDPTLSVNNDETSSGVTPGVISNSVDFGVDQYLILSLQNGSVGITSRINRVTVQILRT